MTSLLQLELAPKLQPNYRWGHEELPPVGPMDGIQPAFPGSRQGSSFSTVIFLGLNLPPFPVAVCLGKLDTVRPLSSWHAALHVDAASLRLRAVLPGLAPPSSAAAFSPPAKIASWLCGKVNCVLGGLEMGKSCPQ